MRPDFALILVSVSLLACQAAKSGEGGGAFTAEDAGAAAADATTPDATTPDATTPDATTPDATTADGGGADAGAGDVAAVETAAGWMRRGADSGEGDTVWAWNTPEIVCADDPDVQQDAATQADSTAADTATQADSTQADAASGGDTSTGDAGGPAQADTAGAADTAGTADAGTPGAADAGTADAGAADAGAADAAPSAPQKDPAFEAQPEPGSDWLMEVAADAVDLTLDLDTSNGVALAAEAAFAASGVQPGEAVPDFTLWTLEGKQASLGSFLKKGNVLLLSASASCWVFRDFSRPQLAKVQAYADAITAKTGESLQIVIVLTKEAHPAIDPSPYVAQQWTGAMNVQEQVLVRQTTTFGMRVKHGLGLMQRFPLAAANLLIDGMDDKVWQELGAMPNSAMLIKKNGKLVWKEPWALMSGSSYDNPSALPDLVKQIGALLGGAQ